MTTITQRKKLSKGTWALLIITFIAIIAIAVAAFLGYINLAFLANWATGTMSFGASSWVNAVIVLVVPFIGGVLACYVVYTYFKGQQTTIQNPGVYTPQGQSVGTPNQSGKETVIS
jgi:H+/Cl- antiporter ClcA